MKTVSGEELFDHLASCVADFIKKVCQKSHSHTQVQLQLNFSGRVLHTTDVIND